MNSRLHSGTPQITAVQRRDQYHVNRHVLPSVKSTSTLFYCVPAVRKARSPSYERACGCAARRGLAGRPYRGVRGRLAGSGHPPAAATGAGRVLAAGRHPAGSVGHVHPGIQPDAGRLGPGQPHSGGPPDLLERRPGRAARDGQQCPVRRRAVAARPGHCLAPHGPHRARCVDRLVTRSLVARRGPGRRAHPGGQPGDRRARRGDSVCAARRAAVAAGPTRRAGPVRRSPGDRRPSRPGSLATALGQPGLLRGAARPTGPRRRCPARSPR